MKASEVLDNLKRRFPNEPEYHQAVSEVLGTIEEAYNEHPEFEKSNLIERLCIPDRIFSFRVTWMDDKGQIQTNMGYRIQHNNAIGPYKGGIRFHASVNQERNHAAIPPFLQATAQIGNNDNLLFLLFGKLAFHFKSTDTFHLISKKVDTERKLGRKGKDVDNTAAHSILPRLVHIIHILEPIAAQHFRNKVHIHLFAGMKLQGFISQFLTGYNFFRQRIRIGNYTKPFFSLLQVRFSEETAAIRIVGRDYSEVLALIKQF